MTGRIWRWLALCILMCGVAHDTHSYDTCQVNQNNVAMCPGMGLSEVPRDLPTSLVELYLSNNNIRSISKEDFSNYTDLKVLDLGFNNISKIEIESFQSNWLLEKLTLFNNSLMEIPALALSPLQNLKELDISNNLYVNSTLNEVFDTFTNLEVLSMGGSKIQWISKDDFLPLKNIVLKKFALKAAFNSLYYEKGAFAVLNTSALWCDFSLDKNARVLPLILGDLRGKSMNLLRLRNLFSTCYYSGEMDLFQGLADVDVEQITLYRGNINENLLSLLLYNLQMSNITSLSLVAIEFERSLNSTAVEAGYQNMFLNQLLLKDISNPNILRFDGTFTWLSKVVNLFIINVNFNFVPCKAWGEMKNVVVLNVSSNRITNQIIYNPSCQNPLLPKVEQFNASSNSITSLKCISVMTFQWPSLRIVDLSYNGIGALNETCSWGPPITTFILHDTSIKRTVFQCLPTSLEYLDLSNSELDQLPTLYFSQATNLSELILSNNRIKFIPSNWASPNLKVLTVDGNSFGTISKDSFARMPNLGTLIAGNNPYYCTCELHAFFTDTIERGDLAISDWPQNYKCYHPQELRHTMIESFNPGMLECDVTLVVIISVMTTVVVIILLLLLCWKFDLHWYLKATCQIIQSKYRSLKGIPCRMHVYHAFVSYSCSDADWVRTELLYRLEHCSPPYSICIHERDFLPGRWIIDNIIDNMEKSRKVIFVLSQSFVNSEWCNYELYFAHQRCICHTFDDVILVVKEKIAIDSLPNKFCKLRKMLRKKTFLEWPSEANRQPFFWIQLENILGKCSLEIGDKVEQSLINDNSFFQLPVVCSSSSASVFSVNLP